MIMVVVVWACLLLGLTYYWIKSIGPGRGFAAGVLRAGWTLPILLSLFPETITKRIPGTVALQPIHILVDDSLSMKLRDPSGSTASKKVTEVLKRIDDVCIQFGCLPKVTKLSDLAGETRDGYTPISRVMEPWLYKTGGEPWVLLSDGGDYRPAIEWDARLKERGISVSSRRNSGADANSSNESVKKRELGAVVGFGEPRVPGFGIDSIQMSPLAFEGKSVSIGATIVRDDKDASSARRVQVQVMLDGKVTTSGDAIFAAGSTSADVDMNISAPKRGPHIVTIKSMPIDGELDTWDNVQTRVLDVMPNTVGVLHLLGAPAWDGRFMRRFLKAEPKFDVISFFILRDPWDTQHVSEREMSLIPFPVERLFKEELVNFRVIIMQNFTLMRFLQPEYQENLAKFVKDGGGLFFIGGPRALTEMDASSSALASLLPFEMKPDQNPPPTNPLYANPMMNSGIEESLGGMGSSWDPEIPYKIELASPDVSKRSLATVFDSWQELSPRLSAAISMKGLHKMETIKFRDSEITPLLNAKTKEGKSVPLAVASYPGKGRALWLFSDSMWRMAMSSQLGNARSDYNSFMEGAISWLTRDDMKGALSVRDFFVTRQGDSVDVMKWRATFFGSAAKYLKTASVIKLSICGVGIVREGMNFGGASGDAVEVEGEIKASFRDGSLCALKLDVEHQSFGSLSVTGWSLIPETLADENMGPSPSKLKQLAKLTGARFIEAGPDRERNIEEWIQLWGAANGKALPDKMKSTREFYWPMEYTWMWMLVLFVVLEVVVRRWHLIMGSSKIKSETDL